MNKIAKKDSKGIKNSNHLVEMNKFRKENIPKW